MAKIIFDDGAALLILKAFGKEVHMGYIVDSKTKEKVKDIQGEYILIQDFGGVFNNKGEVAFIKNSLHSVIRLVESVIPEGY